MKQTDRVPHKARGADEKRAGVPAERAGVPAESAGTTKTSYPLMKYLSLLLAVALLFSGVTFARYLSNDRIDSSVGIARFDATYSIDRVNTTTFGNQNYWIETGTSGDDIPQGAGSEITVGITLKNNGDTSVQPTLHLEGPKEYWDHIALQLTTARNVAMGKVLTPQLVIKDIVGAPQGEFNTKPSEETDDFGSLGGDATLTLKGNIDAEGGRTATWTYDGFTNKMTIAKTEGTTIDYSVGFVRQSEDDFLPPIYVDCRKETDIYSIDLELPALNVDAAKSADGNRTAAEQRVVVWLTWTNDAPNNSQAANTGFWGDLAAATERFTITSQNGENASEETITILGYHFDVSGVPVTDANGTPVTDANGTPTGKTTTVRIKKTLGSEELEYFHVASINDNDGAYTHTFGECKKITVGDATKTIAQCLNKDESARMYVDLTQFVSEDYQVADAISVSTIRWETDSQTSFQYAPIQQRAFGVSFKATFVQSSEVPVI